MIWRITAELVEDNEVLARVHVSHSPMAAIDEQEHDMCYTALEDSMRQHERTLEWEATRERLGRTVGALIGHDDRVPPIRPDDVEYDELDGEAYFEMETPDGKATIVVKLRND